MSLWVGDKEVGLAPGQTAGDVGGTYVVRPEGSDTSQAYIPGVGSTSIIIEGGATAGKGGSGIGATTTVRRDRYGNITGIKQVDPMGNTIFERKTTPGGGYVEVGLPVGVQYRYAEIEKKRSEIPLYRRTAEYGAKKEAAIKTEAERQKLISQGYKPYTTIEGTTLYTKNQQKQDITIPRFGKMVQRGETTEPVMGVFTPDKFFDQIDKTQRDISTTLEKWNTDISEKYGLPEIVDPAVKSYKHAQFLAEYDPKYKKYGGGQSELGKAGGEFAIGFTEELAQKPVTAAGNALFVLLVTKGIGGAASKLPILTKGVGAGKIARNTNAINILGAGLATMYGIDVAGRYAEAPNKARFLGELTSTELAPFAVGGYLGTKKLPIQYENVKAPSGETLWKGIRVGDQPLIGASQQARLILGKPKPEQIPRFKIKEYMPVTKLETNIMARQEVMKAFGYSQTEINKVNIGLKLMRETETQSSKFTESRLLRGTKSMSEKGTDVFLKYVREQKDVVDKIYGSFGARSQLKPEYRRLPGDIDIQLTTTEAGAIKFTKNLVSRLRASGEKVRVSKDSPTLIETYGKAGEHHAVDIHYKGEPSTDILTPGEEVSRYGLKVGQKSIKIEDYNIMPLSEQGIRKGASVLTWRQEGKVAPAAHRLKDIPDFIATQITLIESKYGMIPNNHQKLINEWSKLFPEAKGIKGEVKLPLYETVKGKQSPSISIGVSVSPKIVTPSRSISTSSGAKSYQSQYIVSVSKSVEAISRSLSTSVKSSGGYSSAKTPTPSPPYSGFPKTQSSNIQLVSKILSPSSSKSPAPKTPSKPTPTKTPTRRVPKTPDTPPRKTTPQQKKTKDFTKAINDRIRKRRGKWVWDVNNPVPTLEEVLR